MLLHKCFLPVILVAAAVVVAACGTGADSVEPGVSGHKDDGVKAGYHEEWTGGPFVVSNPAVQQPPARSCPTRDDPLCDHYRLTPPGADVARIMIAIAPAEGFEADDYDLYVYDDRDNLLASQADADGNEAVVINNTGGAFYDVRVQPYLVIPGSGYHGVAIATQDRAMDAEGDCLEPVPENVSVAGVLDAGQQVELSVALLLDGTDQAVAEQVMARAADSYQALGINLVLKQSRAVSIASNVSGDIITEAKNAVGGVPPDGIDVVGVFTGKEMQSGDEADATTVIGQADCIGGIRYDQHSFFVVSDVRDIEDNQLGPGLLPNVDATAEVMAHEIGHLMGAHHHYANCVEGNLTSGGPGDVSPCTLMFPAVNFASLNFSAVDGPVVRGHAVEHAAP